MPIGSDFALDYTYKTITHSSGTTVYQMYEMYAWLMDQVDESGTIDDPVPMTAQTPTAFTLTNGWFIDETSLHFLKGGSLKTSGWIGTTNATGIRILSFNSSGYTSAIGTDIGKVVVNGGDSGRLLAYDNTQRKWWVRQNATTDDFPSGSVTITSGTGAGTLSGAAVTGENIWTNIFTLGTLVDNTQLYVVRDDTKLTSWWGMGHIDVLILVQEAGTLIDDGFLSIYARQTTTLYDHYRSDFSDGSRTPVPLASFVDTNNPSGDRQMVLVTTNDAFVEGDLIQDDSDSTIQGVVTSYVSGTNTLQYYLTGASLTDFGAGTGTFASVSPGTGTGTAVAPSAVGPSAFTGITFTFGATSENLNNGNDSRPYDCIIDCNNYALSDVYEYVKYVTRYGSSTSMNFPGTGYDIAGELYTAVGEYFITYGTMGSGSFSAGTTITGGTSGATGYIVSNHTTQGALVVIDVVGTFVAGETISEGANNATIDTGGVDEITPTKQSPFGTYAGGTFFGARGVWLENYLAGDANSFELIDSTGTTQSPPQTIAVIVNNTLSGDKVGVFKTTGDNEIIDKSQYSSHATNNTSGASTFEVTTTIETDTPLSGYIRVPIRNAAGMIVGEDRYQYDSWSGSIFTLNVSNTLSATYDSNDTAYVPYVDMAAVSTSVSQTITYVSDRYVLTVVRIVGMIPFKIKGQITASGLTVQTIRTTDSVYQ